MNAIKDCDAYCQHSKKKETQWTSGARYDPEAEDADQYLRNASSSEDENDDEEDKEEEGIYIYTRGTPYKHAILKRLL